MKSIVGLLEYTVTGAFVWILFAFVFLTVVSIDATANLKAAEVWESWSRNVPPLHLDPAVKDLFSLAVGGTLFIAIFFTGLTLDVAASAVFAVVEIGWARKLLLGGVGRPWLNDLIKEHGELIWADYKALAENESLARPVVWRIGKYRRLKMFLTSYALATSKGGQLEDFLDRLKVWRISQSISLSLLLVLLFLSIWALQTWDQRLPAQALVILVFVPTMLVLFSYLTVRTTFFRVMVSLETSVYLGWKEAQRAAQRPASARGPTLGFRARR